MTETLRLIDRLHGPRLVELRLEANAIVTTNGPLAGPHQDSRAEYLDAAQAKLALARRLHALQMAGYQLGEHHPGLIARIAADPDEVEHYLVYADWLLEQGDPRGELIRVMEGLDQLPTNLELGLRRAELWEQHDLRFGRPAWAQLDLRWRCGFVESLRLRENTYVANVGPGSWLESTIMSVFHHPSGRFIRRVHAGEQIFALRPDAFGRPLVLERVG
jgi:uncharacterized protein (TIGR02996 family)